MQETIHRLAMREAFSRVPETCPHVHSAGVDAIMKFQRWLHRTSWYATLTDSQSDKLDTRISMLVSDISEAVKDTATQPLRKALVDTLEELMPLRMGPERLKAIQEGKDDNSNTLHDA